MGVSDSDTLFVASTWMIQVQQLREYHIKQTYLYRSILELQGMFQFLRFRYQMSIRVHSASTVQVLAIHGRIVRDSHGGWWLCL